MGPWLLSALFIGMPAVAIAQQAPSPVVPLTAADSAYLKAQRLVNEGKGVEGRAIVDSLFRLAAPGSHSQAEALFWRATLATTGAEAERDYRQITVEHPLSRRAEDALLRLAQLELQRGDRTLALAHLERLLREHGTGTARSRGAYWMARVYLETNDTVRACAALADARRSVAASDVELRNQIEYAAQRCPAALAATTPAVLAPAQTPVTAAPSPTSSPKTTATATNPAATNISTTTASATVPAPVGPAPSTSNPSMANPSSATTATGVVPNPSPDTITGPPVLDTSRAAVALRSPDTSGRTTPRVNTTTPAATPREPSAPAESQRFSVQVAAFQTKAEADRLVKKYRANGYDARTFGTVAPFRVRIARFRTRAEAVELARVLKEKSGAAFVVVAEPR